MKKIITFCLLLSVSAAAYSQVDTSSVPAMKTDYLKKGKNQKTIAWVMLGGGFVLTSVGTIIALNDLGNGLDNILNPDYTYHDHSTAASIFAVTGIASMLGSIPLFISAKHNKHKALEISFKNDFVPGLQKSFIVKKPVEQVSFALSF